MGSKYVDFPLNLGSKTLVRDSEQVIQKIRLLLTTEPGEFIDIPTFGTPIMQYLYEGITDNTKNLIRMSVTHAINTWLDGQVRIDSLEVESDIDGGVLSVVLGLFLLEFDKSVVVVESYNV